ncbi:hypothetical protein DYE48_04300 [Halobacillus trueperi]|uniref:Uncharacterized protein n=1 Tax=Halobacillus trueperi TaxID=156205 RepID=A0A3E0JD22_9BACI|nr:hypothetical protein DYE48_04300 [Halobacillus trueperi]
MRKACYRALYAYNIRKWKAPSHSKEVRFSPSWNGVVGKLRDSRGRKEIGEIPQDVVRGSSALPHRKVFECGIALVDTTGISRTATECAFHSFAVLLMTRVSGRWS